MAQGVTERGGRGTSREPIRLGVVDDHEAIRIGVIGATELEGRAARVPVRVTCQASTVEELLQLGAAGCQVVALDLALADGSSPADNVTRLRERGCQVVIYSLADNPTVLREALMAGAAGYVRKSESVARLIAMVRDVHAGRQVVCREFAAVVDGDAPFGRAALTEKEREAVALYAAGLSIEATAQRMQCTPATVKTYVDRARAKYQAQDRPAGQKVQLFINAIEDGIIPPVVPYRR